MAGARGGGPGGRPGTPGSLAARGATKGAAGPTVRTLGPYVPASRILNETTLKAIVLVVLLAMVLAGANAYLGLFAGITVSASIPAAVISMGVLRAFRDRNILENNIVQTGASAGESLAAGVIFTLPALVILGFWDSFQGHFLEVFLIAAFAGLLGVIFTIPMRRAFIVEERLKYPEGVATAEVLEVGEEGGSGLKVIALGGLIGATFKLAMSGMLLWQEVLQGAQRMGRSLVYAGTNLSPALVAVGYIVGLNIATVIFLGGVIAWFIGIPLYLLANPWPTADGVDLSAVDAAGTIWSTQIRYMGVGAMVVGGLYALLRLVRPIGNGIRSGWQAYRAARGGGSAVVERTDRDLPIPVVATVGGIALVPLFIVFLVATDNAFYSLAMALMTVVAGFVFSAVAGYMAGVVGSSNNPISGVTIATALAMGGLLYLLGVPDVIGPVATVFVAAAIACAAAIAGDNLQDLKAGHIVGATPARQQVAQMTGVLSGAVILPFVLLLLDSAYGIGVATAEHPNPLRAPQATLIGAVAGSFFGAPIPYGMVGIGALIALLVIAADRALEARGGEFRIPVLAAAIGIYLPLELTLPIFVGGLAAWAVGRMQVRYRRRDLADVEFRERKASGLRHGLLFASGLIAGEAVMGILIAVPIFVTQSREVLAVFGTPAAVPLSGTVLLAYVIGLLIYIGVKPVLGRANEPR